MRNRYDPRLTCAGNVKEGARSVWQFEQLRIYDGGPDGIASTEDGNQLFQVQGLFVP